MTDYYAHRLNMLNATLSHFDEHPGVWQDEEAIAEQVPHVRDGRDAMVAADAVKGGSNTEAVTEQKQAARAALIEVLEAFSKKVRAFALVTKDAELRRDAGRTKTEWGRLPDADLARDAQIAANKVEPHLDAMAAKYKVTAETLATIRESATAYARFGEKRENLKADRKTANQDVVKSYQNLSEPLEILDLLVPTLLEDAAFVAEYERVRRILGE